MNLEWMALSALLIACLGFMMGRTAEVEGIPVIGWIAVAAATVLIFERGYYWNIFGRGEGYWTLNRISAGVLLIALFTGACLVGTNARKVEEKWRRERGDSDYL